MGNIWRGKFWQTIQVKAIGEENLANKLQSVYVPNTFSVYSIYVSASIGEKNFPVYSNPVWTANPCTHTPCVMGYNKKRLIQR